MITAITATGDRELAFSLCKRWMHRQTVYPDQWIVVDDGETPMNPYPDCDYVRREPSEGVTLPDNMKAALPLICGDKIIIVEDDEYYAPRYIETMAAMLDNYDVCGIGYSKYYHIAGYYDRHPNRTHASLAQTAFTRSFLPAFAELLEGTPWLDVRLWKIAAKAFSRHVFDDGIPGLYVGIKGLPGRKGIGVGHDIKMWGYKKDPGYEVLRQWCPDAETYIALAEETEC